MATVSVPFLRLRHRDPQRLWVGVAAGSLILHGLLLGLGLPLVVRMQIASKADAVAADTAIVPVDWVALSVPPDAAQAEDPAAIAPELENSAVLNPSLPGQADSPQPSSAPGTQPNFSPGDGERPTSPRPNSDRTDRSRPDDSESSSLPNQTAGDRPSNGLPGSSGGGESTVPMPNPVRDGASDTSSGEPGASPTEGSVLLQISPGVTPTDEADIPSQLPTLIDRRPRLVSLDTAFAICTLANPTVALQYSQSDLTAALRLTVEADGQVSRVSVYSSSGDRTFDDFMRCLVDQQNLRFVPAQDGGQPVPTTLAIFNVSLRLP